MTCGCVSLDLRIYLFDNPRLNRYRNIYVHIGRHDLVRKILGSDLKALNLVDISVVELDSSRLGVVVILYETVDIKVTDTGFFIAYSIILIPFGYVDDLLVAVFVFR